MTIGIAATGPDAGRAVVRGLAAVEAVGRGAIGGFVSFVAILPDGRLVRAATQRGGTAALFEGDAMPDEVAAATVAGLMASGPDRPEPLSQFTPADGSVGLVTGHRMPNTVGASGIHVNDEVLALMRSGAGAEAAVASVVVANPEVDAGIIALGIGGDLAAANTAHVGRRGDAGRALLRGQDGATAVAVLHNAIHPHRPIAGLAAETVLDVMQPEDRPDGWITFSQGVRLATGADDAIEIGADGAVEQIVVRNGKFLAGRWSLGIGYRTLVTRDSAPVAVMVYEPYMVVERGRLLSIDGRGQLSVPIRLGTP